MEVIKNRTGGGCENYHIASADGAEAINEVD